MGGSSIFTLSALAVDNEMVGRESDAELICGVGELKVCCCAASREAVAD